MKTSTQNNELVRVIETSGLDKTKAQVLLDKFTGYFEIASEWERKTKELIVNDISQVTEMKMAREARLFLSKKRIDIEKTRKALKEDSLREGQTIDAIAKILKNLIEPIENELEKKERFAEIKEAERKAELKAERLALLLPLGFQFENGFDLGSMDEKMFQSLKLGLETAKKEKEDAERKVEEEKIAKEKAEAEEKERIRVENEKLKEEVLAKEKQLAKERAEAEEKATKAKSEADAKLKEEKATNEKLQAEIRAKAEAEEKAKREAQAKADAELKAKQRAEEKAAKAPKKQKLNKWIDGFVMGLPAGMNEDETVIEIIEKFEAFKKWAKAKIETV